MLKPLSAYGKYGKVWKGLIIIVSLRFGRPIIFIFLFLRQMQNSIVLEWHVKKKKKSCQCLNTIYRFFFLQMNYYNFMFCFSAFTVISHILFVSSCKWWSMEISQNSLRSVKSSLRCWTLLIYLYHR